MGKIDPYLIIFNFFDKYGNSPYLKVGIIVFGIFLILVMIAMVRKHIFKISMKGATFGFFLGIFLMILIDLVIIFGFVDKSKVQKLASPDARREAVGEIFISGVTNIGNVLGVSTVTTTSQKPKTAQEVVGDFMNLPESEAKKVRSLLCPQ